MLAILGIEPRPVANKINSYSLQKYMKRVKEFSYMLESIVFTIWIAIKE